MNAEKKENTLAERLLYKMFSDEKNEIYLYSLYMYQSKLGFEIQEVWLLVWIILHHKVLSSLTPSIEELSNFTGIPAAKLMSILKKIQEKDLLMIVRTTTEGGKRKNRKYFLRPLYARLDECLVDTLNNYNYQANFKEKERHSSKNKVKRIQEFNGFLQELDKRVERFQKESKSEQTRRKK